MKIARHGFNPHIGNSDDGPREVSLRETNAFQIRPSWGSVSAFQNHMTFVLRIECHAALPTPKKNEWLPTTVLQRILETQASHSREVDLGWQRILSLRVAGPRPQTPAP